LSQADTPYTCSLGLKARNMPTRLSWEGIAERVTGIEPAFSAWEADVLPLNYTRGGRPQ
jgi:hypothetical protein